MGNFLGFEKGGNLRILVMVLAAFSLPFLPHVEASGITTKVGTKCTKPGLTKSGLICKRVKGKLIWVTQAAKPTSSSPPTQSPTPTPTPTQTTPPPRVRFDVKVDCVPKNGCPEVSVDQALPIAACKMPDLSANREISMSGGFPRPFFAKASVASPKVLLMPVNFRDLAFKDPAAELAPEITTTTDFYLRSSRGKTTLKFIVPSLSSAISIPDTVEEFKKRHNNDLGAATDAILAKMPVDLTDGIDALILTTPRSSTIAWGGGGGPLWQAKSSKVAVYFALGSYGPKNLAHILGHAVYALPDLYVSSWAKAEGFVTPQTQISYDVMAETLSDDFVAWNRWLNGWIDDSEVDCLSLENGRVVRYIHFLDEAKTGKKLLVMPLGKFKVMAAEYRAASKEGYCCEKFDSNGKGLLIYSYDTSIRPGYSQMRAFSKNLLVNGESATYEGVTFKVLAADSLGLYVELSRP